MKLAVRWREEGIWAVRQRDRRRPDEGREKERVRERIRQRLTGGPAGARRRQFRNAPRGKGEASTDGRPGDGGGARGCAGCGRPGGGGGDG